MSPRWTPDPKIRRGRSVVCDLHVHLVFITKYRRDALNDAMLTHCEQIMRQICVDLGAELREFNGEDDHVHLLVHYPPKLPISTLVNRLKGVSAHYLRKEFTGQINQHIMHGHLWSPSYFAASCGDAPLKAIKDYIKGQKHPGP
ncbi:IS200/IS605 family transposase [Micromonospora ureilytica]|uniref:IS200/IS605 family transposase n=1 Tax=Micromonospora ureilytica TaxID=709868 RepID=A0A3N9XPR3_9ACTN|nr:IS200/IS605 family transposase [Micromonospora ureilytica]RQX14789.1 IS200/IS605 family transposase [Micromonospora ureilytica]